MTTPVTREVPVTVRVFVQRFSSTPRGARLARRLAVHQLHRWGFPYGSEASGTVELLVAELAANAVTHGRVPGRDCELTLTYTPGLLLRVDVSDTRGERRPPCGAPDRARLIDGEGGRGLLLVEALASRWTVLDRVPVGKTVRAELDLPRTRSGRPACPSGG
ncbi:ATP-binding protein [Streptomyces sp. NBC_01255]|uniref:ATP-binding protein n=1 Tax=Streptomyces sp. NBC_01255 TaxID=2903798 RepID=UPI002E301CE8|nr:ATP-binding protein [Streptomyces sp. NBC_01255]